MRRYGGVRHEARQAGKNTRSGCEANRCEGAGYGKWHKVWVCGHNDGTKTEKRTDENKKTNRHTHTHTHTNTMAAILQTQ